MTDSPLSPRTLRGAIVGVDIFNPLASVIVFQYNPDTMTRRLQARASNSEQADRNEALRLSGPPKETITLAIEVDQSDQPVTSGLTGVHPPLAALEMLLYPAALPDALDRIDDDLDATALIPDDAPSATRNMLSSLLAGDPDARTW